MTATGNADVGLARSYLYVPGSNARLLAGAQGWRPDAVIADLEDAVAPADKPAARTVVSAWASQSTPAQQWVRINVDTVEADVDAAVGEHLTGLVVPKADLDLVARVNALLDDLERRPGRAGVVALLPLIESARGLAEVGEIARLPRVHRIGLGEVDLAADLGIELDDDRVHLTPIRLQVVCASAAAGIARPVGPTSTAFRDLGLFERTSRELRRLGFRGRTAVHPSQVEVVHAVFTPSDSELDAARHLVDLSRRARGGAVTGDDGRLIDAAVVRSAYETIALRSVAREDPGEAGASHTSL